MGAETAGNVLQYKEKWVQTSMTLQLLSAKDMLSRIHSHSGSGWVGHRAL